MMKWRLVRRGVVRCLLCRGVGGKKKGSLELALLCINRFALNARDGTRTWHAHRGA